MEPTTQTQTDAKTDPIAHTIPTGGTTQKEIRRTRTDIEYLADGQFWSPDGDGWRNSRLVNHGWIYSGGEYTDLGEAIAHVTNVLRDRGRFDPVIHMMGVPEYVALIDCWGPIDTLVKIAEYLSIRAFVDEVIDTRDDNWGLIPSADPVRHFGFMDPGAQVLHEGVLVVGDPETTPSIIRAIEREAVARGYSAKRQPDERTRSGRSTHRTIIGDL